MKPTKNIILCLMLFAITLWTSGCLFGGTDNSATSDSINSTGSTGNELSTFSLPATIAKLEVDTIDNTTIYFIPGTDPDAEIIGTLFWKQKNRACGRSALLASDNVLDVVESDSRNDCQNSTQIGSELADIDLALVNLGPGTQLNNGVLTGPVSLPTGIIIRSPISGLTTHHTLTVMSTFMSNLTDLSTDIAKDVVDRELAFLVENGETESIAFVTEDENQNLNLSTVPIIGGDITDVVALDELPLSLKNTLADSDLDSLYLLDEALSLFRISADGSSTKFSIRHIYKSDSTKFWPHPNGDYLAYMAEAGEGYVTLGLYDIFNNEDLGQIPISGSTRNYTSMQADWQNSTTLILTNQDSEKKYRLQKTNILGFVESNQEVTLKTILSQDTAVFKPVADNGTNKYTFYLCRSSQDNVTNLCRYSDSSNSVEIVASYGNNIVDLVISKDRGSFVIFEVASSPHYICVHDISTERNTCVSSGTSPAASHNSNNIISFHTQLSGTSQVGLFNTDNNFILNPRDLEISPTSREVAAGSSVSIVAQGGVPPYDFSISSGVGTITSLGYYTAPESASSSQSAVVLVTDADGNTASASITIPAASSLDEVVGDDGIKHYNFNDNATAWDMLEQSDGKILIAGEASNGSNTDLAVIRVSNLTGDLDTSFGANGIALIDIAGQDDAAYAIDLQEDGKIVIVGEASVSGVNKTVIARLGSNGTLDTSFGSSGFTLTQFGTGDSNFRDVQILDDGSIITLGTATQASTQQDYLLAQFTSAGAFDTSFASVGYTLVDFGASQNDVGMTLAVQYDDYIVVGGYSKLGGVERFSLMRFEPDGDLDTSFATSGKRYTSIGNSYNSIKKIVIEDDGDIVAAGVAKNSGSAQEFAMARYDSSGDLDTDFSSDGYAIITTPSSDNSSISDMVIQSDGKYVVGGSSSASSSKFYLTRVNVDGTMDSDYGTSGIVGTTIDSHSLINALIITEDDMVWAAGSSQEGSVTRMTLTKYFP